MEHRAEIERELSGLARRLRRGLATQDDVLNDKEIRKP